MNDEVIECVLNLIKTKSRRKDALKEWLSSTAPRDCAMVIRDVLIKQNVATKIVEKAELMGECGMVALRVYCELTPFCTLYDILSFTYRYLLMLDLDAI